MAAETSPLFEIIKLGVKKRLRCYFHPNFNQHVLSAGYGWVHTTSTHRERHGQEYTLHHTTMPKEGDVIRHIKSGREFTVGKVEGFVCYHVPLLENGKQVSTLLFEEYYKD